MKILRNLLLTVLLAAALALSVHAGGVTLRVLDARGAYQTTEVLPVSLTFEGAPLQTDIPAFIQGGRTLVPVRFVSEQLGALVTWKPENRQIQIETGTTSIMLAIGSPEAVVNGKTVPLYGGVAPTLAAMDGTGARTMVPVRFVSEQLGAEVGYDGATRTVSITREPVPTYAVSEPRLTDGTIVIDAAQAPEISTLPGRVVLDFHAGLFAEGKVFGKLAVDGGIVAAARYNQYDDGRSSSPTARVVLDLRDGKGLADLSIVHEGGRLTVRPAAAGEGEGEAPSGDAPPIGEAPPAETPPAQPETPPVQPETPPVQPEAPLIVIDAGHGGSDTGAIQFGHNEKELVLPIALEAGKRLEEAGYRVSYTRAGDATVTLAGRAMQANAEQASVFVSVHANAFAQKPEVNGIETYCHETGGESERLARCIHSAALSVTGANDRLVRTADYYVLRNTEMPAVLLETGYMTNEAECAKLADPAYRASLARAICGGVRAFLESGT